MDTAIVLFFVGAFLVYNLARIATTLEGIRNELRTKEKEAHNDKGR